MNDLLKPRPADPLAVPQTEAARLLGVTDRTIRNWEDRGLIRGNRVGGVVLYPFDELKRLAFGGQKEGAA